MDRWMGSIELNRFLSCFMIKPYLKLENHLGSRWHPFSFTIIKIIHGWTDKGTDKIQNQQVSFHPQKYATIKICCRYVG